MNTPPEASTDDSTFVQSLARGIQVIRAFGAETTEMTLSDVARATSLSRATARRFLLTLEELGYVHSTGRTFSLTPKVLELGFSHLSSLTLPDAAKPHLERLTAITGESTSAAVLDGTDVLYIARVSARRIVTTSIDVGTRLPAYATAMGRVFLSALDDDDLDVALDRSAMRQLTPRTVIDRDLIRAEVERIRKQGWALVDREALEVGLRAIAAPVYRDGKVVAAINVSASAREGMPSSVLGRYKEPLLQAANALTEDLRHLVY